MAGHGANVTLNKMRYVSHMVNFIMKYFSGRLFVWSGPDYCGVCGHLVPQWLTRDVAISLINHEKLGKNKIKLITHPDVETAPYRAAWHE